MGPGRWFGDGCPDVRQLAHTVPTPFGRPKSGRYVFLNTADFHWTSRPKEACIGDDMRALSRPPAEGSRTPDLRIANDLTLHVGLASTLGELGRWEDAKMPVSETLRPDPNFSIKKYMAGLSYRDAAELGRFEIGLRKAGLPA